MKFSISKFATLAALSLVFTLAAVVRLECARDELWIDEHITAWTVAASFDESTERARISHQGPIYTWLMLGVTRMFGMSAASLRGPSVISGLLLVATSAWLAWQLTKLRLAAILAAFLASIDPDFVFYASEARPYALVQFLGLCSAGCVWKWYSRFVSPDAGKCCAKLCLQNESDPPRRTAELLTNREERLSASFSLPKTVNAKLVKIQAFIPLAIWIGSAIAMFYCHFTSVFAIASHALIGWIAAFRLGKGKTHWLAATIVVAVLCVPGGLALFAMYGQAEDWRAFSSLAGLLNSLQFAGLIYMFPAITGLACAAVDRRVRPNADWVGVLVLIGIAMATVVAVALVTSLGIAPLGHYRYVIAATGLGPVVGACYLAAVKRAWMRGLAATVLALAAWSQTSIGGNLEQGTLQAPLRWERWSQIAQTINGETQAQPMPVIVFPNLIEDYRMSERDLGAHQSYFWAPLVVFNRLDGRCQVFALPTWSQNRFDASSLEKIRRAGGVWLVIRGGSEPHPPRQGTLADLIIDELRMKLTDQGAELIQDYFGPPRSDVQLFRVRLVPPK